MAAQACSSWIEVETQSGHLRRHWCAEVGAHVVHEAVVLFDFGTATPVPEMVLDEPRRLRWAT